MFSLDKGPKGEPLAEEGRSRAGNRFKEGEFSSLLPQGNQQLPNRVRLPTASFVEVPIIGCGPPWAPCLRDDLFQPHSYTSVWPCSGAQHSQEPALPQGTGLQRCSSAMFPEWWAQAEEIGSCLPGVVAIPAAPPAFLTLEEWPHGQLALCFSFLRFLFKFKLDNVQGNIVLGVEFSASTLLYNS